MSESYGGVAEKLEPRSKQDLRLWLRLLACTNLVERDVRLRLRLHFDVTLPRFDFLAVLYRADGSLTMGDVSRHLMVSNGNVTGVAERLERQGLIRRRPWAQDRRTWHVVLTDVGRGAFERMAMEHEDWIASLFGGLSDEESARLLTLLGKLKHGLETAGRGDRT